MLDQNLYNLYRIGGLSKWSCSLLVQTCIDQLFIQTCIDQLVDWGASDRYEYGSAKVYTGLAGLFDRFLLSGGKVPFLAALKMGDLIMDMGI